jgi:hypothetical protein
VATNGSSYLPVFIAAAAGEVRRTVFVNGTTSSATSGTTTGSSASIVLYKNASSAGSIIATFNGSGTAVATLGTGLLLTSGTAGSTNGRFAAGDLIIAEFKGGVANNGSQLGCLVQVDYVYGRDSGAAPTAATGPA